MASSEEVIIVEDWLSVVCWSNVVWMTASGGQLLMTEALAARTWSSEVAWSEVIVA